MTELLTALQGLVNNNFGETLDVPHPADIKDVRITPLTAVWHNSALDIDRDRQDNGDWRSDIVKGRLVEVIRLDPYGEPLGDPQLVLEHKYVHPTRQSKDVSTTVVKPNNIRMLKERFPGVFAEYETKLLRERKDVPLVMLDSVPPEVIQLVFTMGARTVKDFAAFDGDQIDELLSKMLAQKLNSRTNYLPDYLARAREMSGHVPATEDSQPAPRRGRPPASQAA